MSSIKKTALILVVAGGLLVGGLALTSNQAQAMTVPSAAQIVTSATGAPHWHPGPGHHHWRHRHHRPWVRRPYRRVYWRGRYYRRHRCVWRPGFRGLFGLWHRGRLVCW